VIGRINLLPARPRADRKIINGLIVPIMGQGKHPPSVALQQLGVIQMDN
jgi:hypothetical protein